MDNRTQKGPGATRQISVPMGARMARLAQLSPLAAWSIAATGAIAWSLLAGWWTPRGPLSTGEALWSIGISVAVGVVAGIASRSRWTMLAAPILFMVGFELTRMRIDGPMVDGIHFSQNGLFALAAGRGFHALVSVLPLILGAAAGAGLARRAQSATTTQGGLRPVRRIVAVLAAAGLIAFTVLLARPSSTEPIIGAEGHPLAGSVAELTSIDINGHSLGMMIRGHDTTNPVLLFLAGGPGGSERGAMRNHLSDLEKHFTVATWDQRGAGTSYSELDPTSTYTLDSVVADTITVTNYLRERFGQEKIYLLGQSWGTTLGVLAVQQHPELYVAYIGTGQMVSQRATDRVFYRDTLAWARRSGHTELADRLAATGPPPYASMLDYEAALLHEQQVYPYDHTGNSEGAGGFSENFFVSEYALIDQIHLVAGFLDTFNVLYPQLQHIDFRVDAETLPIPVFFVQGAHEAAGRAEPFAQWYAALRAPHKELAVFEHAGHRPLFERPEQFVAFMTDTVLAHSG